MPALIEENVARFIKEIECDRSHIEILVFLWRNRRCKYNGKQIAFGTSLIPIDVIRALGFLLNKGLVVACRRNDILYYSITKDRWMRGQVNDLSELGDVALQELMEGACDYGVY